MKEKVLVTGANGYIGRHVVESLGRYNCDILVSTIENTAPNNTCSVVSSSIFDTENTHLYEDLGSPDRCIHLAWRDGFDHGSFAHINDLPLHAHFIQTMLEGGLKSISVMGSMHEIGYWEGPVDENTPTNPLSFYGISKNALREIAMLEAKQECETKLKWLRAYYIFGDDISNHSVFSKLIEASRNGTTEFPFTSGKNEYDFIEIHDLANQIVSATMQDEIGGIINCCSGKPESLGSKVEGFIAQHNLNIKLKYGEFPDRAYDSPAIWGDNTKISIIMKNNK